MSKSQESCFWSCTPLLFSFSCLYMSNTLEMSCWFLQPYFFSFFPFVWTQCNRAKNATVSSVMRVVTFCNNMKRLVRNTSTLKENGSIKRNELIRKYDKSIYRKWLGCNITDYNLLILNYVMHEESRTTEKSCGLADPRVPNVFHSFYQLRRQNELWSRHDSKEFFSKFKSCPTFLESVRFKTSASSLQPRQLYTTPFHLAESLPRNPLYSLEACLWVDFVRFSQ